jgi:branched-subunit amino acid transport protein
MNGGGHEGLWLWLVFLCVGLATVLPRASFLVLGGRVSLPPVVQRSLRYAPAAALAAVVAPDLFVTEGRVTVFSAEVAAALLVLVVARRWRNPWLPFLVGMGSLWGLRWLLVQWGA